MASVRIEPDSYGELCPASHCEGHHIDITEEEKPVLVSFVHMKTASDVSCLPVANHMPQDRNCGNLLVSVYRNLIL
jgi:hypothetical protein